MKNARRFYREAILVNQNEEKEKAGVAYESDGIKARIESILSTCDCDDAAAMRAEEAELGPDDDDGWLTIDPDQLDETLEKYRRRGELIKEGDDVGGNDGSGGSRRRRNDDGNNKK